jgi:hypothetical protein
MIQNECKKINSNIVLTQKRSIAIGTIYQHYSGKKYKVIALAHDSEDPSQLRVIYQGLYDCPTFGPNPIWDRPYTMFAEQVTINGKTQFRFEEITE